MLLKGTLIKTLLDLFHTLPFVDSLNPFVDATEGLKVGLSEHLLLCEECF
jgi:hypothetical protein